MKGPQADTLRELFVSSLFSTCIFGLITQIAFIRSDFALDQVPDLLPSSDLSNETSFFYSHETYRPLPDSGAEAASAAEPIHIGMILKGIGGPAPKALKLKKQFFVLLSSLLEKSRERTHPLHFVFLTDMGSVGTLLRLLKTTIAARDPHPESITFDFVDVAALAAHYRDGLAALRPHFTSSSLAAAKYRDDLFLVAPFYHRFFPFRRLIMLDADLKFRVSIEELYAYYDHFDEESLMSVANDLAPHYYHVFRFHRGKNSKSSAGFPGREQGFNTGVVLYDLDRMRRSKLFNEVMDNENDEIKLLADKYQFKSHLGDQCFFSLLGQEYPQLFHALPCAYNYQLDTSMAHNPEFASIFDKFHNCTDEPKIFHGNGGTSIPREDDEFFWGEKQNQR